MYRPACTILVALLISAPQLVWGFQLEGTADFEVQRSDETEPQFTVVSIAGFRQGPDGHGASTLEAFTEFGPNDMVDGSTEVAGQLWIELTITSYLEGVDRLFGAEESAVFARYETWGTDGTPVFEGQLSAGWVDTEALWDDQEVYLADITVNLAFVDTARGQQRLVAGVLFGGAAGTAPQNTTSERRVVRRHSDRGCSGDSSVVYVYEPAYEPEPSDNYDGCAGDDYDDRSDDYDDGSGGCGGDDLDTGSSEPADSSSDTGCAGDDLDDGSDSSSDDSSESMSCSGDDTDDSDSSGDGDDEDDGDSSSPQCEGDDLSQSGFGLPSPRSVRRSRPFVTSVARHIHIWAPLAFLLLARRRPRRGWRNEASPGRNNAAEEVG